MSKLLAVIHYKDDDTAYKNADIAFSADFEGVCLIHMNGKDDLIETAASEIKRRYPDRLVITNRLMTHPVDMIRRDHQLGLDGSWCDNPGVSSKGITQLAIDISETLSEVKQENKNFLFFGSVAFKTQGVDPDPATAAVRAKNLGWIATTSGPETGIAPEISKLEDMKMAIASFDLAVASGVNPNNAKEISEHVDWVLVATGISSSFYEFDEGLATKLRAEIPKEK
jgi:hypothetical protein